MAYNNSKKKYEIVDLDQSAEEDTDETYDVDEADEADDADEALLYRRESRKANRWLLKIVVAIVIILVLFAVFHSKCELRTVVVGGSTIYSQQEIWELTTEGPQDMYAPFYAFTLWKNKGKNIPFIEKLDSKWSLAAPDTVEITVYEKKIIGCVYAMGGYFYFDRDGLVCDFSDKRLYEVTLVEGLDFSSIVVGQKLKVQKEKYFDVLLNLALLIEDSELEFQKIQILQDDAVVLYTGDTVVKAGKRDSYDIVMDALPRILKSLKDKNLILLMENYSESNTTVVGQPKDLE